MTAVALAAALAACSVLYVARGFLGRAVEGDDLLEPVDRARLALLDERDRALAALQELEFDHRTGKVSEGDYAAMLGPLRRDAARALVALDGDGESGNEQAGAREPLAGAPSEDAVAGPAAHEP